MWSIWGHRGRLKRIPTELDTSYIWKLCWQKRLLLRPQDYCCSLITLYTHRKAQFNIYIFQYRLLTEAVCHFMSPLWSHSSRSSPARWSTSALRWRWTLASLTLVSFTILPETAMEVWRFSTLCGQPAGTKRIWPGFNIRLNGERLFKVEEEASMSKTGSKLSKYRGLKRLVWQGSKKVHFFCPLCSAIQKLDPKESMCRSLPVPYWE